MGKKGRGRARRVKANEKNEAQALNFAHSLESRWAAIERWNLSSSGCGHGAEEIFPKGHACRSFVDKFLDVLHSDDDEHKKINTTTGEVFVYALEQTYCSHRAVWDNFEDRMKVAADLLRRGTDYLLMRDMKDPQAVLGLAGAFASTVALLEKYDSKKAAMIEMGLAQSANPRVEVPKSGFEMLFAHDSLEEAQRFDLKQMDLLNGCEKTILAFCSKRIPCQCLSERYKSAKPQAKTGLCSYCENSHDRSKLKLCQVRNFSTVLLLGNALSLHLEDAFNAIECKLSLTGVQAQTVLFEGLPGEALARA